MEALDRGASPHSTYSRASTQSRSPTDPPPTPLNHGLMPTVKLFHRTGPLVPIHTVFLSRFYLKGIIGHGGYGQIYLGEDLKTRGRHRSVAIKMEPKVRKGRVEQRLILEQKILSELKGVPHFPNLIGSGNCKTFNYIILPLLSRNINELMKESPHLRFSTSTTGRILVQSIAAIRHLHQAGYVHRDIKPHNMCMGMTPLTQHQLFLLDFGLARRYLDERGALRPPRFNSGFRGTLRYVSTRVHLRNEQSPCDDLMSLVYCGLEFLLGMVPWRRVPKDEICGLKERLIGGEQIDTLTTRPFVDFAKLVDSLEYDDEPDYRLLQETLFDMYHPTGLLDPYDWDNNFADVGPPPLRDLSS